MAVRFLHERPKLPCQHCHTGINPEKDIYYGCETCCRGHGTGDRRYYYLCQQCWSSDAVKHEHDMFIEMGTSSPERRYRSITSTNNPTCVHPVVSNKHCIKRTISDFCKEYGQPCQSCHEYTLARCGRCCLSFYCSDRCRRDDQLQHVTYCDDIMYGRQRLIMNKSVTRIT